MADAEIRVPTTSLAVTIEEKRNSRLRKIAISQVVFGSIYGLITFVEEFEYSSFAYWFPLLLIQLIPAFLIVINGLLLLCCKCDDGACDRNCKLKGHYVLGIISSALLVFCWIDDITTIINRFPYNYYHYNSSSVFHEVVRPLLISILTFINFGLVIWSTVIAGKLSNSCCCADVQSDTNNYQPQQVVYVQQGTPENPQIIMLQPSAHDIQSIQPNSNRMVPLTAVIMQPRMRSSQEEMQPSQNLLEVQPTSSPNQEINNQVLEPPLDGSDVSSTPEVDRPPEDEDLQPEQPEVTITNSNTQPLLPV